MKFKILEIFLKQYYEDPISPEDALKIQDRDWRLARVMSNLNPNKFLYCIQKNDGTLYNPLYPKSQVLGQVVQTW